VSIGASYGGMVFALCTIIGVGVLLVVFFLIWLGMKIYQYQLKRWNDENKIEIYVAPDTRVDNRTVDRDDPTAKLPRKK
jgi:hypothetical protein